MFPDRERPFRFTSPFPLEEFYGNYAYDAVISAPKKRADKYLVEEQDSLGASPYLNSFITNQAKHLEGNSSNNSFYMKGALIIHCGLRIKLGELKQFLPDIPLDTIAAYVLANEEADPDIFRFKNPENIPIRRNSVSFLIFSSELISKEEDFFNAFDRGDISSKSTDIDNFVFGATDMYYLLKTPYTQKLKCRYERFVRKDKTDPPRNGLFLNGCRLNGGFKA